MKGLLEVEEVAVEVFFVVVAVVSGGECLICRFVVAM
jgi:hypothetical protein